MMETTEMSRESVPGKNSASRDGFGSSDLGMRCWDALGGQRNAMGQLCAVNGDRSKNAPKPEHQPPNFPPMPCQIGRELRSGTRHRVTCGEPPVSMWGD